MLLLGMISMSSGRSREAESEEGWGLHLVSQDFRSSSLTQAARRRRGNSAENPIPSVGGDLVIYDGNGIAVARVSSGSANRIPIEKQQHCYLQEYSQIESLTEVILRCPSPHAVVRRGTKQ